MSANAGTACSIARSVRALRLVPPFAHALRRRVGRHLGLDAREQLGVVGQLRAAVPGRTIRRSPARTRERLRMPSKSDVAVEPAEDERVGLAVAEPQRAAAAHRQRERDRSTAIIDARSSDDGDDMARQGSGHRDHGGRQGHADALAAAEGAASARRASSLLQHVLDTAAALGAAAHRRRHRPRRRRGRGIGAHVRRCSPSCARSRSSAPATRCSRPCRCCRDDGMTLVLNGDVPLIEAGTAAALVDAARRRAPRAADGRARRSDAATAASCATPTAATEAIVAHRRGQGRERRAARDPRGLHRLDGARRPPRSSAGSAALRNDNAQGEYYLTDVVAAAVADGVPVVAVAAAATRSRSQGVNSPLQLAAARARATSGAQADAPDGSRRAPGRPGALRRARHARLRQRRRDRRQLRLRRPRRARRRRAHRRELRDPQRVDRRRRARSTPFTHIDGESAGVRVGAGALVGPFARLRPGARPRRGACTSATSSR